jgi:cytochrome c553
MRQRFYATHGLVSSPMFLLAASRRVRPWLKTASPPVAGKVTPCTACHGLDLRGLGPVPRLAGRSPGYIARQLYDMQHGNRAGTWTPLMAAVVANLGPDDLMTASAYLASLGP